MGITLSIFFSLIAVLGVSAQLKPQCPVIEIVGPPKLTPIGGTMNFEVQPSKPLPAGVKYVWTVSAGMIESGQGTKSITVRVPARSPVTNIEAAVTILDTPTPCLITAREVAGVEPYRELEALDSYGSLRLNDEKERVQSDAESVKSNPGYKLLIFRFLPQTRRSDLSRIRQLSDFLIKCGLRRSEFQFIVQTHTDPQTNIFVVPKDFVYKPKD